jgi:hypothetical protein
MTLTHFFGRAAGVARQPAPANGVPQRLGLRAGDWVEVRPLEEVMATLDAQGALDALPFMPEMARFCGRRFQVYKTAHKTCDTIRTFTGRRLEATVHLAGLRCDGSGHGGCEAACLLFWKEAWLRPVEAPHAADPPPPEGSETARRGLARLEQQARREGFPDADPRYRCQATELVRASAPLNIFDPRPYLRDLTSGNLDGWTLLRALLHSLGFFLGTRLRRLHHRTAVAVPAVEPLNLQPGELVRVRSKAEIQETLEDGVRNRGLSFDSEMAPFCGGTFRVLRRAERIIEEGTGRMLRLRKDCIQLDGVVCSGLRCGVRRLGCTKSVYSYWREAWLARVEPAKAQSATKPEETAKH